MDNSVLLDHDACIEHIRCVISREAYGSVARAMSRIPYFHPATEWCPGMHGNSWDAINGAFRG